MKDDMMKTVIIQDDFTGKGVLVATSDDMTPGELEEFLQRLQVFLDAEGVQLRSYALNVGDR